MTKRLHLVALAIAAVLAVSATSVAATTGVLALGSSPRSTVTPPPTKKRVQQPQAAKIKALQKALTAVKAKVKALEKALAKAKTPAQKKALAKALAQAKAKEKALEKALAKAKQPTCARGYKPAKGKCVRA